MRIIILLTLLVAGCGAAAPRRPDQDPEDTEALLKRIKELESELAKANADLARLRTEIFTMHLKAAAPDARDGVLRDALRSPFPELRVASIRAIAGLAPDKQGPFIADVIATLKDGSAASRAEAVTFLGRVDNDNARREVLKAVEDPAPEVRRAAAGALRSSEGVDALVGLLDDPVREVRTAAVESLGAARSARAVAPLILLVKSEKELAVIEKAVDALGVIGSKDALDTIIGTLKKEDATDGLRFSAINALGKIGDPRAAEEIRPYLDKGHADNIREIAMVGVGKLKDVPSTAALLKTLADDQDRPRLREQAARSLGAIGDKSALDGLLAAVGGFENGLCRAAWTAALVLAGDSLPLLMRLASYALKAGRRVEIEEVCAKLHTVKEPKTELLALEDQIAAAAMAARDWRAALGHLDRLARTADVLLRRAQCHRELGEFDLALKAGADATAVAVKGDTSWWAAHLDRIATFDAAKRHADLVRESWDLLAVKDAPAEVRAAHGRGSKALIDALCGTDADARSRAAGAIKELGTRILGPLADALEDPVRKESLAVIIEAGNAAAGTAFPATEDPKKIAAEWRKK
jgi:HEAT repeat protein